MMYAKLNANFKRFNKNFKPQDFMILDTLSATSMVTERSTNLERIKMQIIKAIAVYSVMFILMFGAWQTLSAQKPPVTPDLTGRWGVTYVTHEGGGTRPSVYITLFVSTATAEHPMDELSGIYRDDTGNICPVKGGALATAFNLTAVCPKDQIEFNGAIQPDGTITGTYKYLYVGLDQGTFKMEKIICWLPEGCSGTKTVSVRPQWANAKY
jgi:hypothetical protein